jgi:hypothetical protein
MGWTELYGQSKQNLTSLIGTMSDLAMRMKELKQRKKDNWMQLLNTGVGIAGDIGGGYLKNKWQTESEKGLIGDRLAAEKELAGEKHGWDVEAAELERQQQQDERGFRTRQSTAESMADTRRLAAQLRGNKEVANIQAAGRDRNEKDKAFLPNSWAEVSWMTYMNSGAGARRGITDAKGNVDWSKVNEEVINEWFSQSYDDAAAKMMEATGETLSPSVWRKALTSYVGSYTAPVEEKVEDRSVAIERRSGLSKQLDTLTATVMETAKLKGKGAEATKAIRAAYDRPAGRPMDEASISKAIAKLQELYSQLQNLPNVAGTTMGAQGELSVPETITSPVPQTGGILDKLKGLLKGRK